MVSWALAGLAACINATSELLGRHGVAVAVIAALVPPLAKGCLALKLLLEANSVDAKARFSALTQSWQDQLTELRITEALGAQWHKVERLHQNADAQRLAVTQADRLANLELAGFGLVDAGHTPGAVADPRIVRVFRCGRRPAAYTRLDLAEVSEAALQAAARRGREAEGGHPRRRRPLLRAARRARPRQ